MKREVVIVGSGIAGTTIAYLLTKRGHRVTLFEIGPEYPHPYAKQYEDEILHQYRDPAYVIAPDLRGLEVTGHYSNSHELPFEQIMAMGGMATRWTAWTPRYLPSNFDSHTRFGYGVDWPIGYAELEPYYCKAEELLGVSGTDADNPWAPPRSSPYPMPEFEMASDDLVLAARLADNGIKLHTVPQARTRTAYDGRPGCVNFGVCGVCPIGARYSPRHHLALAEKTGLLTLKKESAVRAVLSERAGAATAVAYHPDNAMRVEELGAEIVVLAAGAIETARLLLLSARPGGHARAFTASGHVGRNLMFNHIWGANSIYRDRLYAGRVGAKSAQSYQFIDPPGRKRHGGVKVDFASMPTNFLGRDYTGRGTGAWLTGPTPVYSRWFTGEDVLAALEKLPRSREYAVHAETIPTDQKLVELSKVRVDRFGDPFARVHHESSEFDEAARLFSHEVLKSLAEKSGAEDYRLKTEKNGFNSGHHHLGTCRMGKGVRDSVVDSFGALHGVSNLYLTGGAIFTGSAALNPTLTIVALAIRTADHIAQALGPP